MLKLDIWKPHEQSLSALPVEKALGAAFKVLAETRAEETGREVGARDEEFVVDAEDVTEEDEVLEAAMLDVEEADEEVEVLDKMLDGLVLLEDDVVDDDDEVEAVAVEAEELVLSEEVVSELVLLEDVDVEREVEELVEGDEVVDGVDDVSGFSELLSVSTSSSEVLRVNSSEEGGA